MNFKKILASALLGGFAVSNMVFAANAKIPGHPRVNQVNRRENRQAGRIQQGVKSGQLTKGETKKLRTEGKAIKAEEHTMRKADNGHLTKADQRALNQQQNKRSKQIYRMKHNNKTTAPPPAKSN